MHVTFLLLLKKRIDVHFHGYLQIFIRLNLIIFANLQCYAD